MDWRNNPYNVRNFIEEQHIKTRDDINRLKRYHYRLSADIETIEERLRVIEEDIKWTRFLMIGCGIVLAIILIVGH